MSSTLCSTDSYPLCPAPVARSPFAQYVGGALVLALRLSLNAIEGIVRAISSFAMQASAATGILVGLSAGFIAYNVVMGAVTTVTKGAAVAQAALNLAMKLNPVALVISGAVGIVVAYVGVVNQSNKTKGATDRLAQAKREMKLASDAAKEAERTAYGMLCSISKVQHWP